MSHHSLLKLTPALALIALASCGANKHATNGSNGGTAVENETLTKLSLTSDAFQDGQPIPAYHTCDGANQSPPLSWGEPPQGTKSFALVIDDPDAPGGTFRHWGAFDIPASTRRIGAGQQPGTQAMNDFGKAGYGGPCPPKGHGPHHYHFKLFALDTDKLGLSARAKVADVENSATQHAIAEGELVGTYERK
jgi:Raf kinase inhibitor-like YbhB/YbcL family protein